MAKAKAVESPVIQLLRLTWGNVAPDSWDSLNHALDSALSLAVIHRFEFALEDFVLMQKLPREGGFNFGYWGGVLGGEGSLGEHYYTLACNVHARYGVNRSAAMAFEHWKGRKPFIIQSSPRTRARHRIACRSRFVWHGRVLTCTSFAVDGSRLVACDYINGAGEHCDTPCRIVKIRHGDIRAHYTKNKAR